jgi:hypothetical protein
MLLVMACLLLSLSVLYFVHEPFLTCKGPTLQELARAAQLSGLDCQDIDDMAKLGTFGRHASNISKSLIDKHCKSDELVVPQPYVAQVPMLVRRGNTEEVVMTEHHFFLPTDWVASITKSGDPDVIRQVFSFDKVKDFWNGHDSEDPKLHNNPVTKVKGFRETMVPMLLHGDGGQFQRRDSLNVISLHSVLSSFSTAFKFLFLTAVPKKCTNVDKNNNDMDTMYAIWQVLVWNLKAAFKGVHPAKQHTGESWPANSYRAKVAGQQLFQGYKLWLFGINPDLEYLQNIFGLKCHSFDQCCWMCPANKSNIPFTDARPLALWRQKMYSPQDNRRKPATEHLIMQVPGVVNETFCIETLHTNELGVTSHYIGNVLWDQIYNKYGAGKTVAVRMSNLWNLVMQTYSDLGVSSSNRLGKLTLEMFTSGGPYSDYPCLSQSKARQARYLLPVVVKISEANMAQYPNPYTGHCATAGRALLKMYEVMDTAGMHPTLMERVDFREAVDEFQMNYAALATESQQREEKKWNFVNKFHYSAHSPDHFDFFNIRFCSAYGGETEVGLICSLGHRCLDGTPAHKISYKLAYKYRLGQHLRLVHNAEVAVENPDDD